MPTAPIPIQSRVYTGSCLKYLSLLYTQNWIFMYVAYPEMSSKNTIFLKIYSHLWECATSRAVGWKVWGESRRIYHESFPDHDKSDCLKLHSVRKGNMTILTILLTNIPKDKCWKKRCQTSKKHVFVSIVPGWPQDIGREKYNHNHCYPIHCLNKKENTLYQYFLLFFETWKTNGFGMKR